MEKLNDYFKLLDKINEVESILKDLKKLRTESEESLVSDAVDQGIEKMSLDNCNVKFSYENIISIAGGNKDTEQRRELLTILSELGFSEFIQTIPTIDGRKLNIILKDIDPEIMQNLEDQSSSYKGEKGAILMAVSAADGKILTQYDLDNPPVFDGLIAADSRLYMTTTNGQILCMAGK